MFLISTLFYFLGEKLLFTKGAESSILPRSKSGEIDKTRVHVDEFALVSVDMPPSWLEENSSGTDSVTWINCKWHVVRPESSLLWM